MKLSNGKGISGKGRLTDGKIDVLQNYYGLSVRENLNDVSVMDASHYHVASSEENPQHHLCPDGEKSLCGYRRYPTSYKHRNGIPECTLKLIEPIFADLSKPEPVAKVYPWLDTKHQRVLKWSNLGQMSKDYRCGASDC